jgi:hypothetical protein
LIRLSLQACLIAKDAAQNLSDGLATGSSMSWLAVAECEKELDQIDQYIDENIANAIIDAGEQEIRELLACLKFTIDLERNRRPDPGGRNTIAQPHRSAAFDGCEGPGKDGNRP